MKLCRFEVASSPGVVRSGIVHGGKVYETDGVQPIAVYEWTEARLLPPILMPPAFRLFPSTVGGLADWVHAADLQGAGPEFCYVNSGGIFGTFGGVRPSPLSDKLAVKPCLAFVVGDSGIPTSEEDADKSILGFTIAAVLYAPDLEQRELATGLGPTRSHEVGVAVGPAITTPDEIEDIVLRAERGKVYRMDLSVKINGEPIAEYPLDALPFTFAEMVLHAGAGGALRSGDLFAVSLGSLPSAGSLTPGDEVQITINQLGSLTFGIAPRLGA